MKIAIKANHNRGKEIISLLESLGGIKGTLDGSGIYYTYYIDKNNMIRYSSPPKDYEVYTLEEFEKEFPFKVGDKVTIITDTPYKIVALEYYMGRLCYRLDNGLPYSPNTLTIYKEMKEERTVTLSLEKAKEWYSKGGELREIALQAFTEKELTKVDLPKTWEEFCKNYPTKKGESYVGALCEIHTMSVAEDSRDIEMDRNVCPSKQSAEAHLAMIQLEQLRDCYRGLFVTVIGMPVWCIIRHNGRLVISPRTWGMNETFLSFQSREVAEEYLKNFKPLIEKAGDLIS